MFGFRFADTREVQPPQSRYHASRRLILIGLTIVSVLTSARGEHEALAATHAPPRVDADNARPGGYGWFEGGHRWQGEFADPEVVFDNGTYYAYSSGAGGRYLGIQTSTDATHWTALDHWSNHLAPWQGGPNPRTDGTIPLEIRRSNQNVGDIYNLNDAIARPAAWGVTMNYNAWYRRDYWAVGVGHIGDKWYTWAPVKISHQLGDGTWDPEGFGRYCLTMAVGRTPIGPFRDVTGAAPYYCDGDPGGSIDPSHFVDPATGNHYLTWKAAGRRSRPGVQGYPSALKVVQLDGNAKMVGPIRTLLTTAEGSWEGYTVENPSMIRFRNTWYLFYSANSFIPNAQGHSNYATGYAICSGPMGPCHRVTGSPLMASTARKTGMGGAAAFTDKAGNLRLAAAAFWPGEYRTYPIHQPRRMFVVTLTRRNDATLVLAG